MTVSDLCRAMEQIAPTWTAEEWDNVGLLAGDSAWPAQRILLTIDLTGPVLDEAVRRKTDVILAYHPPVFRPVKRMVIDRTDQAGIAAEAVSRRIAIYSPHTALDAAPGGPNDLLAGLCGLTDVVPANAMAGGVPQCKLVVFVPAAQVNAVADAVFDAGAGRIGEYEKCSYRLHGEGTFFGTEATDPVVGKKGRLEQVEEIRLEIIFPKARLSDVIAAVRRSHPYEEPAFDVYPLETPPDGRIGQGRIGRFKKAVTLASLSRLLARKTGAANVLTVFSKGLGRSEPTCLKPALLPDGAPRASSGALGDTSRAKPGALVRGVVWVGAAGRAPFEMTGVSLGPGDVVVTGEIRHHEALRYQRCGAAAIALGHWASERPVLAPLAARLKGLLAGTIVNVSRADGDPFKAL